MSQQGVFSSGSITPPASAVGYGQVYNQSAKVFNIGQTFTFDSNGPLVNISHVAGSDTVTVTATGTYLIRWLVNFQGTGGKFGLLQNGVLVPAGSLVTSTGAFEPVAEAIVNVTAGDTFQLRNDTGLNGLTTDFGAGYTNMSMTFEKLAGGGASSGATSFPTNSGTANQTGGVLNIVGGTGIVTSGAGSTVTISSSGTSTYNYTFVTTTPYVVVANDEYLGVQTSSLAITVQLPNAPAVGRAYIIKDRSGAAATRNITVTTVGGAVNIDGAPTFVMNTNLESIEVIFNGTTYEVF